MKKKFFSGDSLRQALLQAGRYFQVEPEQVAYREVDRRHGFLRGRRRAVIEVDLDHPIRAEASTEEQPPAPPAGEPPRPVPTPASADATANSDTAAGAAAEAEDEQEGAAPALAEVRFEDGGEREDRSPPPGLQDLPTAEMPAAMLERLGAAGAPETGERREEPPPAESPGAETRPETAAPAESKPKSAIAADPELAVAVRQALARLFELGRLDLDVESVRQGEEKLEIELRGADEEYLLEDRGRLLLAIQHLLPRMLRGLTGKSSPCQVDCDDFHEIRTEQLRDLAQRVASEVRNRRRSRTLEPMSPDERRIVHLTLADDPAVETVSQGNGLFKRVQIRPQKLRPRGFDPFSRDE